MFTVDRTLVFDHCSYCASIISILLINNILFVFPCHSILFRLNINCYKNQIKVKTNLCLVVKKFVLFLLFTTWSTQKP